MYQYGRNYLLKIYDRDVGNLFTLQSSPTNEGLRVTFDIQKNVDNKSTANTAKVVIYNLSQATLSKLSDKQMACQIKKHREHKATCSRCKSQPTLYSLDRRALDVC